MIDTEVTESQDTLQFCQTAKKVITAEAEAVQALIPRINHDFATCCKLIMKTEGRVVILGLGKSGHIGKKIAATLASTGTPAFFIHPSEASHGDLGMITHLDVVIMISNSGETEELLHLIPLIQRLNIPIIAMTGRHDSTLAQKANHLLDVEVANEAGDLGLAPTSSTTVALVMGDALALALLEARGFTEADFAFFHPGGSLGKRLLLEVGDLMVKGNAIPNVKPEATILAALMEVSEKRLGMTVVSNQAQAVLGIFTDGDLRRSIDSNHDLHTTQIQAVMTQNCQCIKPSMLASEALTLMRQRKITSLVVTDEQEKLIGVIHMHDLLRAGVS